MNIQLSEALTAQFYEWEERGRGWLIFDKPIDLEPPFYPFFGHGVKLPKVIDDSKRPTIFQRIGSLFQEEKTTVTTGNSEDSVIEPYPFENTDPIYCLKVTLPKGTNVEAQESEQLLLMLSNSTCPISFEIVAAQKSISLQFACREPDVEYIHKQIKGYFPLAAVQIIEDPITAKLHEKVYVSVVDFGLRYEFTRPIATFDSRDLDPFIGLFASLENIGKDECATIQILFKGTLNPWAESIMRSVCDNEGKSFFMDAPEMVSLAEEKIASPLYGVTIKLMGLSPTVQGAEEIVNTVGKAFVRLYTSNSNSLIPFTDESYQFNDMVSDIAYRESRRLGMILNGKELANFVHLPGADIASSILERDTKKTKAVPEIATGNDFIIGTNTHQGVERKVSLNSAQRLRHVHAIGATGTGKSTLLLNLITEDILQGHGIAVLDPHGDLIESILSYIPETRYDDVIVLDPSDGEYPVGFNILQAHSEIEKDILSSDLVAVFRRLSTSWGDQMNSVFANAILAFLESSVGGTLADLRKFLIEKSYRDTFLKTVSDPNVLYYWQKEYPLLRTNSIAPILTRLDTFLRPKLIRNMVAQKKSLDFENILDSGKILLVRLSQGLIGEENSYLLGTVIVSKIYQAAMARQAKAKETRNDFFLYIDEFQNFICPSMTGILSGARKYHLGLILAHQDMQQLQKNDSELASSVIGNAGSRICFRIGDTDAKKFESGFSSFEAKDLQGLNTGETICRIDRPDYDFNLEITPIAEKESEIAETVKNTVIERSRKKYGTPKAEIENILRSHHVMEEMPATETPIEQPKKETKPVIPLTEKQEIATKENLVRQKEQSEHRYLQTLIKRMAEARGYKTTIEEPTPDRKGRVDVSLEKGGKKIAVEISVTTSEDWELHNIEKCISAGYETIVVCSNERKNLEKIWNYAKERLDAKYHERILTFQPEEFFLYLDKQVAKESNKEQHIKGYRVKVEYNAVPDSEASQKKAHILKAVADSLKKKKQ